MAETIITPIETKMSPAAAAMVARLARSKKSTARFEEYKSLRTSGHTPTSAGDIMSLSKGAKIKLERRLRRTMAADDYIAIQTPQSRRASGRFLLEHAATRDEICDVSPLLEKADLGALAEDFIFYQLRRRGFNVHRAPSNQKSSDIFVLFNQRYLRVQVKAVSDGDRVSITRMIWRDGKYRDIKYQRGEIEFFALVNLKNEQVFIVPFADATGTSFSLTPLSDAWKFRDRYDLISQHIELAPQ